jgi:hypothetical protein
LLDEQRFFFPTGTTMTDDTAFCLKARERGHRFIGDFGLMVHHWGYNVAHQEVMKIAVELDPVMEARRTLNREKGVYVHPKVDGNISAAVRKLIDIDKIKQIVDTHK